ncbi:MAG: DUF1552 domain-containing protein [Myxococcota bacterium]
MSRREFLRAAALGLGGTALSPLVAHLVGRAHGQAERTNLIVLTGGNGWGHQGMARDGEPLYTDVRSVANWDLPAALAPLRPIREQVSILRAFRNRGDGDLHGSGWSTLTGVRGDGRNANGVSVDRLVAQHTGANDAFSSLAFGVPVRAGRPAPCTSSDGLLRPFPAIASVEEAFVSVFGGTDRAAAQRALDGELSILDGMRDDLERARSALAGIEQAKLDQMLHSLRETERAVQGRLALLESREPPPFPDGNVDGGGLNPDAIMGFAEIGAQAIAFGLTRVVHLSLLGFNAHNAGWGALGYGGDAHENLMHRSGLSRLGYSADDAVRDILRFQSEVLLHMWQILADTEVAGGGTEADRTLILWVNSGGGKHHDGRNRHPAVLIGDAGGRLRRGQYVERGDAPNINQLFLSVAQACGAEVDVFGRPEDSEGPLAEIMA